MLIGVIKKVGMSAWVDPGAEGPTLTSREVCGHVRTNERFQGLPYGDIGSRVSSARMLTPVTSAARDAVMEGGSEGVFLLRLISLEK